MILAGARILSAAGWVDGAWLAVEGTRFGAIGRGPTSSDASVVDLSGHLIVPGFIDLHMHGADGAWVDSPDSADIQKAVSFHRRHGTTRTLVSLMSAPVDDLTASLRRIGRLTGDGGAILGCHVEGPFLNPRRAGAQDPERLILPDRGVLRQLLEACRGVVRMITVAPELPGATDLIRATVAADVIAALGHSDASFDEACVAIKAGASVATHVFNGMRPLNHREPGLVGAVLSSHDVVCELINDGVHLHDAVARLMFSVLGPERLALITDSVAPAGCADGDYVVGSRRLRVTEGKSILSDGSSLAGSTLTMAAAVQRAVRVLGVPLEVACRSASLVPARVLGVDGRYGSIASAKEADLVVFDSALEIVAVMASGAWIVPPVPPSSHTSQ